MASDPLGARSGFRARQNSQAYDELAFRHFLALDRRRAARTTRSLFLVLVAIRRSRGRCARLADSQAAMLFEGMTACVRDIDLIGWYREGYVVAALLPQTAEPELAMSQRIKDRFARALKMRLPETDNNNLRVRIVRLGLQRERNVV